MSEEIQRLREEIENLPKGYISNKNIAGKVRHYRQWKENGKIKSEYIPDDMYESVKTEIERRKELERQLKTLERKKAVKNINVEDYEMNVVFGDALKAVVSTVKGWEKRDCFSNLETYLYGKITPRVCLVYGLRRTGKNTMFHQAISEMNEENFAKTVYIKARKNQTMSMLDIV